MTIKGRPGAPRVSPALGAGKDPRARQSGTSEVEFPLVYENGKLKLAIAANSPLAIDPSRGLYERVADGVEVSSASPYATRLALGNGLMLVKGRVEPRLSDTVQINAKKQLVATVSTMDVTDQNDGTAYAALARKANTADARFPILRYNGALIAGSLAIGLTDIDAGAFVSLTYLVLGGTPGILSATVTAGVGLVINSTSILDTSTFSCIVWNP